MKAHLRCMAEVDGLGVAQAAEDPASADYRDPDSTQASKRGRIADEQSEKKATGSNSTSQTEGEWHTHVRCCAPHLPLPCSLLVAQFSANPPAIYALCMTSKAFHNRGEPEEEVDATKLLREALTASLRRVLKAQAVPLSAVSFASLRETTGLPAAVISGSTLLQVALGEVWPNSDVDIFCTESAADAVHEQLRKHGFRPDDESDSDDEYDTAPVGAPPFMSDSMLDRVDHWHSCEERSEDSSEESSDASQVGTEAKGGLDVVVAKTGCTDARALLASFDILACAVSYDGKAFHIPHPHLTFRKQSCMERKRSLLMDGFAKHWRTDVHTRKELFRGCLSTVLNSIWWNQCVHNAIDSCLSAEPGEDLGHMLMFVSHMRCFNFFLHLFARNKKYSGRGLTIHGSSHDYRKIASTLAKLADRRIETTPTRSGRGGRYE
eukprot:TRINITY_DN111878_c0_g1_i1.p1 TRINITY_DN111878_c0_g1~~TRINITY_DN111878_c0_g1_i1.p1  ORF type:complete len:436 (-),score=53.32 TRINITY_DN111878_c0_g1_i1:194-1501(-)